MENGYDGKLVDRFSGLALSDSPSSASNDGLFQVMKAVEAAETTIKLQVSLFLSLFFFFFFFFKKVHIIFIISRDVYMFWCCVVFINSYWFDSDFVKCGDQCDNFCIWKFSTFWLLVVPIIMCFFESSQVEENNRLRIELEKKAQELAKYVRAFAWDIQNSFRFWFHMNWNANMFF